MSNYEFDKSEKDNAHPIVIQYLFQCKSVIVMLEKNQVNDVDMYEKPSTLRPLTFTYYNNIGRKSIR